MSSTPIQVQNKRLQAAILYAIPRLKEERRKITTRTITVDDRTGYTQSGHIEAGAVRSIVNDIGVSTGEPLPLSFLALLPGERAQTMNPEALDELITHLQQLARTLQ